MNKQFKCEKCYKVFKDKQSLQRHINIKRPKATTPTSSIPKSTKKIGIIRLIENKKPPTIPYGIGYKNYYKQSTIQNTNKDTIFIVGANTNHMKTRCGSSSDGGQAAQTYKNKNIVPVVTVIYGSFTQIIVNNYHNAIERIITDFYKNGGNIVFPMTKNNKTVNVGTGIASRSTEAVKGQKFANDLLKKLENITRDNTKFKKDKMKIFNNKMDKLEKNYK